MYMNEIVKCKHCGRETRYGDMRWFNGKYSCFEGYKADYEDRTGQTYKWDKAVTKQDLLEEWQQRLGLTDWIIVLRYNVKPEDMNTEHVAGEAEWNHINKVAVIRILDEKYFDDRIIKYDFERILIHELLHIKFKYLQRENNTYESKVLDETIHQLIEDLAQALILAKRGKTNRVNENINGIKVKEG